MEFNVADIIERVVTHIPDREALICGEQRASYQQLNTQANHVAALLLREGFEKGDHIAIYAYNCMEWAEALLACYKIGVIPININYRYVEDELVYLFSDADIKGVVYQTQFSSNIEKIRARLPLLRHFIHIDDDSHVTPAMGSIDFNESLTLAYDQALWPQRSSDDHWVLYTGGTTGMPKGVVWKQYDVIMALGGGVDMTTQEAIATPELMADRCIQDNAFYMRSLQMAPLMHGAAQWGLIRALFEGHTVVISANRSFDADEVWSLVAKEKINTLLVTGDAMAKPMMDSLQRAHKEQRSFDTSSLFVFASSAAVFSPYLKDLYSEQLPHAIIMDNIGSTESGYTGATVHEKGKADTGGPRVKPGRGVVVLDEDYCFLQPGSKKQGYIAKGGFIPIAYYKDEKKTAATFITAEDGQRYVIPGDMAQFNDDGTITMLGRGSLCINSGGEKIYPEEVEAAVKSHALVTDCLVVATPDERFGSCVTALISVVDHSQEPCLASIQNQCETMLARYKLPRRLYVVDQIQRAPSGKPNYKWAKAAALKRFEESAV